MKTKKQIRNLVCQKIDMQFNEVLKHCRECINNTDQQYVLKYYGSCLKFSHMLEKYHMNKVITDEECYFLTQCYLGSFSTLLYIEDIKE